MISLLHTERRHTSENLREDLEAVIDEWGIQTVFAVVSDNAANIVKALDECDHVQHTIRCVGHTSQLAIN